MKLVTSAASPFARKVRIIILELDLQDRVELVDPGAVTPVLNNQTLNAINPLGMIPALQLDDGGGLYDSPVICEYLDQLAGGPFFPADSERRLHALRLQALADGILDLAVAIRYEVALRPEALRWPEWIDHQQQKIHRGLAQLEQDCAAFEAEPTIGEIALACALGYLDFRFAETNWRATCPALAGWFENIHQRSSLQQTRPA